MRGSPVGVDVRKVVELGITPKVTTGILHNADGSGQIGAGVAVAPLEVFTNALLDQRALGGVQPEITRRALLRERLALLKALDLCFWGRSKCSSALNGTFPATLSLGHVYSPLRTAVE